MKGNFKGTIDSITELQEQCNAFEQAHSVQLEKLEAVINVNDEKRTEGTFKSFNGSFSQLGNVEISEPGSNSCFINEAKRKVSISRSS